MMMIKKMVINVVLIYLISGRFVFFMLEGQSCECFVLSLAVMRCCKGTFGRGREMRKWKEGNLGKGKKGKGMEMREGKEGEERMEWKRGKEELPNSKFGWRGRGRWERVEARSDFVPVVKIH